jgi:transaldolase
MDIFLDTANLDEIRDVARFGVVCGVTTNPSLIAKEGNVKFEDVIKEIAGIIDGPISAEVISLKATEMVEEAKQLAAWHPNVVIKVPVSEDGVEAISQLSKLGIKTNATLIFSLPQALLVARAGATYCSVFVGRIDDMGEDGAEIVAQAVELYRTFDYETEVLAASIRTVQNVRDVALAGSDVATIPYKVFKQMFKHPLTDKGIDIFMKDWEKRTTN